MLKSRYEGLKEVASTPAEARPVRCNREEFTDPVERENAEFATLYSVCKRRESLMALSNSSILAAAYASNRIIPWHS